MKPNPTFLKKSPEFWALVKLTSEALGYSDRKSKGLRRFMPKEIESLECPAEIPKEAAEFVAEYLNYRAETLEKAVLPLLMNRSEAKKLFQKYLGKYKPKYPFVFNKQKGNKKHLNYLTCLVNVIAEKTLQCHFNHSPRKFIVISDKNNRLVTTLSRWIDGSFPDYFNPVAIWEIKEYYGTTTFGSRVADGVYETQLDGYEINQAEALSGKRILHYLFVDDKFTWWDCGKSYLCRLIDMMHMQLVDEVVFGKEVLTRWPEIIESWKKLPS